MAHRIILGLLLATSLAACNNDGSNPMNASTPSATPAGFTDKPVISGTASTTAVAGHAYSFQPTASDPNGSALTFSIANAPKWAAFNTASGHMAGTPNAGETGAYPNVTITVSNGSASAVLAPFSITVTAATQPAELSISGTPAPSVVVGTPYDFTPSTTDPGAGKLTFSIQNAPSWAAFNAATGELSGTPPAGDVGNDPNIVISVSDGTTRAALPSFAIAVMQSANGSASLQWVAPTENTNGSPLTNLAGYRIYYGTSATTMNQSVQIANPSINTYLLPNLSPATWFFAVKAYTSANVESSASAVASKTIT